MRNITVFIANYFIGISVIITLWIFTTLSKQKRKEFVLIGAIGAVITLILAFVGGQLFYDPRPFVVGHFTPWFPHGNDNGFPSDHALLASYLSILVILFSKKIGMVLFVIAVLIGSARVVAGLHHSVDIIGSFVFSAIGVSVAILVAKQYQQKFNMLLRVTFHV